MAMETIGLGGRLVFDAKQALASMGRVSAVFKRVGKGAREMGERVGTALGNFATSARNAGLALVAVGAGFAFALKDAREFGKAVGEVSTIADDAEFPMEMIRKLTKDMAVQFGTMPIEQAKAMYQAISAGATTAAEATNVMDTANRLAIGGVSDVFTSIDVLTTAVNSYSAAGLEAADASDVIFTTVKLGKTTVDELGSALGQVIPAAADLNVSFEELGAAMATITVGGISTAEASTALNAALMGIRKPSEQAKKAAERLGIEFSAAALKEKDLVTVLREAAVAAEGDDEAITALFGSVRALKAISVLTANEGRKFNEALQAMEGRAGATDEAFAKMSKTTDFQINRMNALRKASMTSLGEILEPLAIRVLAPLGKMAERLFDILEAVRSKDFDKLSGRAAEIAKGIRDAVDSIDESITTATSHFREIGKAMEFAFGKESARDVANSATQLIAISVVVGPLLLALSGLALFIKFVLVPAFALAGLTGAAAFWPITLVVAAIAAAFIFLGEDVYQLIPAFKDVFTTIFNLVEDFILMPIRMIKMGISGVVDAIKLLAKGDVIGAISKLGTTFLDLVLEPIRSVVRGIIRMIDLLTIKGKAEWVPEAVRGFARAAAPEVRGGPGPPRAERRGFAPPPTVEALLPGVTPGKAIAERIAETREKGIEMQSEALKATFKAAEEAKKAAEESAKAAGSSEKAARQRPPVKVEVDGREVARASAKHQEEIKARSGFKATPPI